MQKPQHNLKKRTIKAGLWTVLGHILSQLIRFGGNLILTRLLVPEMFGVMAIVNIIILGLAMLSDIGITQNVIRSERGEDPEFLNTAWTVQIVRGFWISLLILMIGAAFYQAGQWHWIPPTTAYADKDLPYLLVILAGGNLVSGFNSIHLILLNRRLMLSKQVFINVASQVAGLILIIVTAWEYRTVYALASGSVVTALVKMVLSHVMLKDKCRLAWDKDSLNEIMGFGKWIMLSSLLGFMFAQGDRLLLGMFITPELLGIYSVAYFLANAVSEILIRLIASVFFPAISETVRHRPEKLPEIYYKIRYRIDAIALFAAGFLYSTGGKIIELLYDERYHDAGWMMQLLSLSMVSIGFTLANQCFLAHGKSAIVTILMGAQTIALYVGLPFAYQHYGMTGAIWLIAGTPFVRMVISSIYMKTYYFYNFFKEFVMLPLIGVGYGAGILFLHAGEMIATRFPGTLSLFD